MADVKLISLALLFVAAASLTLQAGETTVPDPRLMGQWRGTGHFNGINYNEAAQKKVAGQNIEIVLILTNGTVTGRIGGAEFNQCRATANRGWLGRLLHIKTDFVIHGEIVGAITPDSELGTHSISAPFNLVDNHVTGTVFLVGPVKYPYPFLKLQLSRT